jgi:hypothetical protein
MMLAFITVKLCVFVPPSRNPRVMDFAGRRSTADQLFGCVVAGTNWHEDLSYRTHGPIETGLVTYPVEVLMGLPSRLPDRVEAAANADPAAIPAATTTTPAAAAARTVMRFLTPFDTARSPSSRHG